MPTLRTNDVALSYDVRGRGRPVVLLHGFTSSQADNWGRRGWIDFLADSGFRVVGLDFPSHGASERVYDARRVTTTALAADVVALLDHLAIDHADVFGFSMGGGVALQLAIDYPNRVGRIAVSGVGDAALNRLHDARQIADIIAAFEADITDEVSSPEARRIRRGAEAAGNDLSTLTPFLRDGGWPGGLAAERAIAGPLLVIAAADDQYMGEVDELLRWLAHAQVERVRGRDHYTVLDDERVHARVLDFLRDEMHSRASVSTASGA